ncbi:MAG: hypothetical protein WBK55_02715 [Alphaproteobacteria bacterium]
MIKIVRRPIIGVMGSHEDEWEDYSRPVGELIAKHDYHLLTGAGAGVMMSTARAFCAQEDRLGVSIGIIPTMDYAQGLIASEEFPNPYIEIPVITQLDHKAQNDSMPYSRNNVNVMSSHALIILPGEHGTRNEVALALRYKKPMVLFGPEKEFESFPEMPTRVDDIEQVRMFLEQTVTQIEKDESITI